MRRAGFDVDFVLPPWLLCAAQVEKVLCHSDDFAVLLSAVKSVMSRAAEYLWQGTRIRKKSNSHSSYKKPKIKPLCKSERAADNGDFWG
jgi:hypothetical protein